MDNARYFSVWVSPGYHELDSSCHLPTSGHRWRTLRRALFLRGDRGIRNTVARACTPATILEIEYVAFLLYIRMANDVLAPLVVTMCIRLSDCETRTEILAQRGAQERVGGLLLQLAAKVPEESGRNRKHVVLHVSHIDVARMAAMSRPHVTVTLGRFRRKHLVHILAIGPSPSTFPR
jgi:CRP-like cAMP-binding protein